MQDGGKLVLGEVVEEISGGFRRHGRLILRITLLFAGLNAASNLLNVTGPAGTAISIGILLLLSTVYGGMLTALICLRSSGPDTTGGELWAAVTPLLARLIWVTLITIVAVLAGLMILIIPGLILVTFFAVATQVVVVEHRDAFGSIARSAEMVRGNGLRVFGFVLLLGVVCLLLLSLVTIVTVPLFGTGTGGTTISSFLQNLIVGPLLAVGPAALYNRLRALPGAGPAAPPAP